MREGLAELVGDPFDKVRDLARRCKVNFLVAARRAKEEGILDAATYGELCGRYKALPKPAAGSGSGGGDYFRSKQYRLGNVFSDAVRDAVGTEHLSYRDAYYLTGLTVPSFNKYFGEVA